MTVPVIRPELQSPTDLQGNAFGTYLPRFEPYRRMCSLSM
jgi:hypothetical protein